MTGGEKRTEVSWVDVVVICALEVEFEALAHRLNRRPELVVDAGLGLDHFVAAEGEHFTVLVVQLPDPGAGNVTSGVVASLLIARYDPWLLISFGIAGTLDAEVVETFDVVYSQSIFYLDLRKETGDGSIVKQPVHRRTPSSLPGLIRKMPRPRKYKLHKAVIVTSEAVVKSEEAERRKAAKNAVADATAVEMETFGVFQAAFVDKEHFSRTSRLCLAIKGISDAADLTKSDTTHGQASRNAADTLYRILNKLELSALRSESRIEQRPRPLQPFIRCSPPEVLARVNNFGAIVQPIVHSYLDLSTLQAVHMRWHHPRVFYHWRLTGKGLHWVELKFLRILRHLSDAGYSVECLIADMIRPMQNMRLVEKDIPEARDITRRIVDAMLPARPSSSAVFYSEICQIEETLSQYALRAGSWHEIRDSLSRGDLGMLPGVDPNDTQINLEFNEWLPYIAWRTRHEGVCIILHHHQRMIYSLLSWFSGLTPALIPTGDIKLGGKQGKFWSPGSDLYLFPPDHPEIIKWLRVTSDAGILEEFWAHLTAQGDLTRPALLQERRAWAQGDIVGNLPWGGEPAWIECFLREERGLEYYKGAILLELAWLNETFFANLRERPGG